LSDHLRGRPLPVAEVVRYGIGVANALRHIHERETLYGCLDPDCILLTDSGVELAPAGRQATISSYASPEQLQGKYDDPRSDIFTLGAILYEMLAGCRAFASRPPEELRTAILEREPRELEGVPRPLARLVSTCLEKRPERRFQRAQLVMLELKLIAASLRSPRLWPEFPTGSQPTQPDRAESNGRTRTEPVTQPVPIAQEEIALPTRAEKRRPCPKCKATDVRPSQPRGAVEEALTEFGVKFSRCHRCYHRFMQVAFVSISLE
jgi:serine/threonine protein kinase